MTEPTSPIPDAALPNETQAQSAENIAEGVGPVEEQTLPIVPFASDISGRVALLMASSAVAVAIFLIFLVMKAASSA